MSRRACLLLATLAIGCANGGKQASKPTASTETPTTGGPPTATAASAEAIALLDAYVDLFKRIALTGDAPNVVEFAWLIARASSLRHAGTLDARFHERYHRLVHVTRLMILPAADPELRALVVQQLDAFVADVEGKTRPMDPNGGLAQVAPAFAQEVLNLHALVDRTGSREAARTRYFGDFGQ